MRKHRQLRTPILSIADKQRGNEYETLPAKNGINGFACRAVAFWLVVHIHSRQISLVSSGY
eukprot:6185740-Pleurochrysis_carterae.AAC.1